MLPSVQTRLIQFLDRELKLPPDTIQFALKQTQLLPTLLPMVLWQYGLITLSQLNKIFDWLETT
ncbi:DUF2949 domain-containing protein [Oscillatoria sp. FACHB-1406]|uniref:DUF2949 domain-containing protein n=1 Tax=Oscillatoria sp. FACHB-1406 TaxID=2692846 RepID=UPI001686CE83|nr:DUF2949 domain-containing protein [Oscillatoria sp. FACHB-1406]MBD2578658.1 DUF2949 domain-containing protein [Oscillatoria sp. FACHB-1406]